MPRRPLLGLCVETRDTRGFALRGDGRGEVGRVGAGHRSRRRRARLDLRKRFRRFEERALHDSVGIEQTIATGAQLLELAGQQLSALGEIVDDAFAQAPGLFDHREALFTRTVELGTGLALDARPEVGGVVIGRRAHLGRALVGDPHEIGGPLLGFLEHSVRDRLGLGRPLPQHLFGLLAQALRFLVGLVDEAGGALLRLGADVGRGLAGRPQQPGRLLAERVEQRLLVERLGRAEAGLELVDRAQQLLLTAPARAELLGDPLEEAADVGFGHAPERRRKRPARHLFGCQARCAGDRALPAFAVAHASIVFDSSPNITTAAPEMRSRRLRYAAALLLAGGSGSPPAARSARSASSRVLTPTTGSDPLRVRASATSLNGTMKSCAPR